MKFKDILTESVMQVPDELTKKVEYKIASAICGLLLSTAFDKFSPETMQNSSVRAEYDMYRNAINLLVNTYGAEPMDVRQIESLIDKPMSIQIDSTKFMNQLKNFKLSTEQYNKIKTIMNNKIQVVLSEVGENMLGSFRRYGDVQEIHIGITGVDRRNPMQYVNSVMSTVHHELQHFMQFVVLGNVAPNDKQLTHSPNTGDRIKDYQTSGPERGAHIADIASTIEHSMLNAQMNGKLPTDARSRSAYIKSSIKNAILNNGNTFNFVTSLKDEDEDAWKRMYSTLSSRALKFLDTLENMSPEDRVMIGDVDMKEHSVEVNLMKVLADDIGTYTDMEVQMFGKNISDISEITAKSDEINISIRTANNETFFWKVQYSGHTVNGKMDADETVQVARRIFFQNEVQHDPENAVHLINLAVNSKMEPETMERVFDEIEEIMHYCTEIKGEEVGTVQRVRKDIHFNVGELKFELSLSDTGKNVLECDELSLYQIINPDNLQMYLYSMINCLVKFPDEARSVLENSMGSTGALIQLVNMLNPNK